MGNGVIVIRAMAQTDVPAAAELESRSQPRPWSEQVFEDELAAVGRVYLVATDPAIVGFGGLMLLEDEAHVTNLLVATERRGEGLGRKILVELIRAAIARGARGLTLEVRSRNMVARSLYADVGLVPVGVRPGYYGEDDALIMWVHDIDMPEYLEKLG